MAPSESGGGPRVAVVGLGSWGTAIATVCAPRASRVRGWALEPEVAEGVSERHRNPLYLKEWELPANVVATTSYAEALDGAELVLLAVPSAFVRPTARAIAPYLGEEVPVLVLAKGIEAESGRLMFEVAAEELGQEGRVACLSGPNHSEEVIAGRPAAAVVGATDEALVSAFRDLLGSSSFRIYGTEDRIGVSACGAIKNVVALACGVASGMELGDNTTAVLMTRGLAEMTRIACAMGGNPMTCMGLAGMGDLVATCISPHSRNRTFGRALVAGESIEEFERRTAMVVEGYRAAESAHALAASLGVDAPVVDSVYRLLYEHSPLADEVDGLLARLPRSEFYGIN